MKKTEEWLRKNSKIVFILSMVVFAIVLLLAVRNCSNNIQHNQDVVTAVSQERINELERKIDEKTTQLMYSRKSEDSLWVLVKQQDVQLNKYKVKYADLSNKYDKERNKTRELTNIESVGLFLDNTEQSEFPIIQYEDSTQYVIPIHSIEYANVAFVDLEEQIAVNMNMKEESGIKSMQIKNLNGIIDNKDEQIVVLTEVNKYTNGIITEKDSQIIAEHKKYKQQKIKTYVVGAIGVVLLTLAIIR